MRKSRVRVDKVGERGEKRGEEKKKKKRREEAGQKAGRKAKETKADRPTELEVRTVTRAV